MKKSTWDARANRYERMRAAWIDAIRQGVTKLPFAQFEERMINRDLMVKRAEYMKRITTPNWAKIENALASSQNN